jgi:glucosyl-3-phosphoglycerate synthase
MIETYHFNDFQSVEDLLNCKQDTNASISVVIPARNEESTIGDIIETTCQLMDSTGLVDEIIVMDDASEDTTAKVAYNAGAQVVQVKNVGPSIKQRGKGVALWKSQFIATGSILLFIDADLLDFDERFIIGPVGALLNHRHLELVKAAYRRPLTTGPTTLEDSGGRVTEILIRPLLNLFLPDLADLGQPLAGEYAVRKYSLKNLHFYSGYGVEIGLLLEYYFNYGLDAIGQVNVGSRAHRNRPLSELSSMSTELSQVFFNYLQQEGYCTFNNRYGTIIETSEHGGPKGTHNEMVRLPPKNRIVSYV